ncbi:glycosyltransferase family 2 protein [Cryobacterium sp. Y82]|uniref:glycosyltransferase family 2 protein n=1 Tax=Cryobacterium sp. Y82 TaxID=2045017 RepID=UPI000CE32E37|nr:glycosyltransferase family 2 protein [Cryobacterium sp. Y82]
MTSNSNDPLRPQHLDIDIETLLKLPNIRAENAVTIAAVIPAYNEELSITATIDSLLKQTRPPDAIFVMVNNCTDDTFYIANEFSGSHDIHHRGSTFACDVTVIDMGVNSDKKVGALNSGWLLAHDFTYILGVDGDTVLDTRCIQQLTSEMISDSRIGGISAIYGFDQGPVRGPTGNFLVRSQRFQFAGFNLDNLLRSRNMTVLGGQCSLLSTRAMKVVTDANHQSAPWVTDSEIEDSLLSIQLRSAGFQTKISATARANVGPMLTLRSLNAQQVKWNAGGVELMLQHPLHPNLRLRWRENIGMLANLSSRLAFVLLVAGALSVGSFDFAWWWLIPPIVSIMLSVRIAVAMKDHTWKDVAYALLLFPAEIYIIIRGVHFLQAWAQIIGREDHDNWAAQANAENGGGQSGKWLLATLASTAILAALAFGWVQLELIWQSGILSVGWVVLAILTILQTFNMLGKLTRKHRGFRA